MTSGDLPQWSQRLLPVLSGYEELSPVQGPVSGQAHPQHLTAQNSGSAKHNKCHINNAHSDCSDNLVNLKVLVLGAAGVGKSSLMLRFTDDRFMADILPTVGLDFRVKVGHKYLNTKYECT